MPVSVSHRSVGQVTILKPNGRIDSQSSPEFETTLNQKLEGAQDIILDFSEVPYISSAGLRVVLLVAKRLGRGQGKFALASLKPEILSVFKISGLSSVLKIFDTPEGALASFGAG
jgi:anti-anti-sigma factor